MNDEYISFGSLVLLELRARGVDPETYTREEYQAAEASIGKAFFAVCGQEETKRVRDAYLDMIAEME